MNASCPQCKTVFRVDPRKVPANGVRARCSVCGGVFEVIHDDKPAVAPAARAPGMPEPGRAPARAAEPKRSPPLGTAPPIEATPAPVDEEIEITIAPPAAPGAAQRPRDDITIPAPDPATAPTVQTPAPTPPPLSPPSPPASHKPTPGRRFPFGESDQEARARRLARALISDVAAYHPERQERGLREGRLKELFQDELRKSWQEYAEQVGLETAKNTPYFRDALNEILAKGKRVF